MENATASGSLEAKLKAFKSEPHFRKRPLANRRLELVLAAKVGEARDEDRAETE